MEDKNEKIEDKFLNFMNDFFKKLYDQKQYHLDKVTKDVEIFDFEQEFDKFCNYDENASTAIEIYMNYKQRYRSLMKKGSGVERKIYDVLDEKHQSFLIYMLDCLWSQFFIEELELISRTLIFAERKT